jgi:hypothetical protein
VAESTFSSQGEEITTVSRLNRRARPAEPCREGLNNKESVAFSRVVSGTLCFGPLAEKIILEVGRTYRDE